MVHGYYYYLLITKGPTGPMLSNVHVRYMSSSVRLSVCL